MPMPLCIIIIHMETPLVRFPAHENEQAGSKYAVKQHPCHDGTEHCKDEGLIREVIQPNQIRDDKLSRQDEQ